MTKVNMEDQNTNHQNQFYTPPVDLTSSTSGTPTMVVKSSKQPKVKAKFNKGVILAGILVLMLAASVFGLSQFTGLFSKAAGECIPANIKEADLGANSADITFQTDKTCQVEIVYGTSNQPESLLLQIPEPMASLNHRIRLSPLLPLTTYYYQIKVEGKAVGEIRSFLTLPTSGNSVSQTPKPSVTQAVVSPIVSPTTGVATPSGTVKQYKFEDFQAKFGSTDKTFDIDKNGVVNTMDWFAYESR